MRSNSTVINNSRVAKVKGTWIRAQKPSGSRMAIHQYPASLEDFNLYAPQVAAAMEKLRKETPIGKRERLHLPDHIKVPGARVVRGTMYDDGSLDEIDVKIGESTSPY